jgi:hypothetical protein
LRTISQNSNVHLGGDLELRIEQRRRRRNQIEVMPVCLLDGIMQSRLVAVDERQQRLVVRNFGVGSPAAKLRSRALRVAVYYKNLSAEERERLRGRYRRRRLGNAAFEVRNRDDPTSLPFGPRHTLFGCSHPGECFFKREFLASPGAFRRPGRQVALRGEILEPLLVQAAQRRDLGAGVGRRAFPRIRFQHRIANLVEDVSGLSSHSQERFNRNGLVDFGKPSA